MFDQQLTFDGRSEDIAPATSQDRLFTAPKTIAGQVSMDTDGFRVGDRVVSGQYEGVIQEVNASGFDGLYVVRFPGGDALRPGRELKLVQAEPRQALTTREKRARKADRLRDWADGREEKADQAYNGVKAITDRIPMGQPILVGHHSERGARADQKRIERGMDTFCEHNAKAAEMRSRAENIEKMAAGAIYSDDVDAIERLTAKVAKLEGQRDAMKAANAKFRAAHKAELKAMSPFERSRAVPFPNYALTNIGATIRTAQKRLEELQQPETGRRLTVKWDGECRTCGQALEAGSTAVYFKRSKALECEACAD